MFEWTQETIEGFSSDQEQGGMRLRDAVALALRNDAARPWKDVRSSVNDLLRSDVEALDGYRDKGMDVALEIWPSEDEMGPQQREAVQQYLTSGLRARRLEFAKVHHDVQELDHELSDYSTLLRVEEHFGPMAGLSAYGPEAMASHQRARGPITERVGPGFDMAGGSLVLPDVDPTLPTGRRPLNDPDFDRFKQALLRTQQSEAARLQADPLATIRDAGPPAHERPARRGLPVQPEAGTVSQSASPMAASPAPRRALAVFEERSPKGMPDGPSL